MKENYNDYSDHKLSMTIYHRGKVEHPQLVAGWLIA